MGEASEVNVAIVALIVSLIALIVTLNQLLHQLFNSADGYRRCAESVIDAWHVRRHRKWKWSEFRFETQYVTPQIVIASPLEFQEYEEEYGAIHLINSPGLKDVTCKELEKTVHQDYSHLRRRRDGVLTVEESSRGKDVEKAMSNARRRRRREPTRIKTESDPLVSWLRLLKDLHQLSRSYWPDDCPVCDVPTWDKNETGIVRSDFGSLHTGDIDELPNNARTDIAVIYRTWTWDFMPPDMIRPLSEISIGDIVVLALRMGMQWRAIDPELGKMQADGNGFSLTATEVRGLGVVLRFTGAGTHDRYPRLIPSRAVDKLLLGIVPGDPLLVYKDFSMVEADGRIRDIASPGGILSKIGLRSSRLYEIRHHSNPEIKNDVITLLLPFLPLEGSTMTQYCFPGWHAEPGIRNVHCYWEARIALHRRLQERVEFGTKKMEPIEELELVLHRFNFLEQRHGDDWYARWNWNPSIRDRQEWQIKLSAIKDAREVFDWTTNYFIQKEFNHTLKDGNTKYVHLVAAHANMADYAVEESKAFMANYPHDRSQQALRDHYKFTSQHGYYVVPDLYEVATRYVDHLHHPEHGIASYLREKGIWTDDVEAAWWVLMLRGIAWNISTWHPDGVIEEVLGKPVPSSYYGNKTPVWIT